MKLKRCFAIAGCAICLCAAADPQPGDIVFSDNFDAAALGLDQISLLGGWTVTGGTIDVIGFPGFDPRPGHGHYIDLQGSSGQPGRLSIEIPVETSGEYLVAFDWSGNPRGNAGAIRIDTGLAPSTDGTYTIIDGSSDTSFLSSFHGTGIKEQGVFLLTFLTPAFVDLQDGGRFFPDTGLLLDNVTVTFVRAIPEPSTFALTLVGIVPIVLVVRRRYFNNRSSTNLTIA